MRIRVAATINVGATRIRITVHGRSENLRTSAS